MKTKPVTAADPRDGLLPCPFCGSDAEVDSYDAHAGTFVQCCNCGARVNGGEIEWNSRIAQARPEAVDEAMVRRSLDAQPFFYSRNQGARVWQLFLDERDSEEIVRAILTAALTPERAP